MTPPGSIPWLRRNACLRWGPSRYQAAWLPSTPYAKLPKRCSRRPVVYVKVIVRADCIVISFHEDEEEEAHDEDA